MPRCPAKQVVILKVVLGGHTLALRGRACAHPNQGYLALRTRAVYAETLGESKAIFWASNLEPCDTLPVSCRHLTITYTLVASLDMTRKIIDTLERYLNFTQKVYDWTVVLAHESGFCLNRKSPLALLVDSLRKVVHLHTPMDEHDMMLEPHLLRWSTTDEWDRCFDGRLSVLR